MDYQCFLTASASNVYNVIDILVIMHNMHQTIYNSLDYKHIEHVYTVCMCVCTLRTNFYRSDIIFACVNVSMQLYGELTPCDISVQLLMRNNPDCAYKSQNSELEVLV